MFIKNLKTSNTRIFRCSSGNSLSVLTMGRKIYPLLAWTNNPNVYSFNSCPRIQKTSVIGCIICILKRNPFWNSFIALGHFLELHLAMIVHKNLEDPESWFMTPCDFSFCIVSFWPHHTYSGNFRQSFWISRFSLQM